MAEATPIIAGAGSSPQGIYEASTVKHHPMGTRGYLEDGRAFRYARNSGIALVAGQLTMAEIISADMANEVFAAAAAKGSRTVSVTPSGTKVFAENDLENGFLTVNDGGAVTAQEGYTYLIQSNPATVAATAFTLTLAHGLATDVTTAGEVTIQKNPWTDVVIAAAAAAHMPAGIPQVAVPAGSTTQQYFWCQTWGVCAGWDDASTAIGAPLASGATAGQMEIAAEGASTLTLPIGIQLFTGVATEYYPKYLMIAP